MLNVLIVSLINYTVINNSQYGLKAKTSTSYTFTDVYYITSDLDNGHITMGIIIHLQKAFETVDHDVLLNSYNFMAYVKHQ